MLKSGKEYCFKSIPVWSICCYVFKSGSTLFFVKLPKFSHYGFILHFNAFWLTDRGEYTYFEPDDRVVFIRPVDNLNKEVFK